MPTVATDTEEEVGSISNYKCVARDQCIIGCQEADETKTWYRCMKECPKSLCDNDPESDSVDPEEDDSDLETAVGRNFGAVCYKNGVAGSVTW